MKRRELLKSGAAFGCIAALPFSAPVVDSLFAAAYAPPSDLSGDASPLKAPADGSIPVAFLLSKGAVVIDFTGPWEVFQDVMVPGRMDHPFHPYTVAESLTPIR